MIDTNIIETDTMLIVPSSLFSETTSCGLTLRITECIIVITSVKHPIINQLIDNIKEIITTIHKGLLLKNGVLLNILNKTRMQ